MVCLVVGCGSDAKKAPADQDQKTPSAAADGSKAAAAEKPADKAAEKPAEPDDEEDDFEDALHFNVAADRSGVLARAASTLETTDLLDPDLPLHEHLAELSHHAGRGPSNETLCKHMATLRSTLDVEACAREIEHQRVKLGPEVFTEMATCVTNSKSERELARCEAAEKEAEKLLHENKHGEGLDEKTCEDLFVHFEKLAMADAGEHEKLVEEVLEEVRADVIEACLDHGTKAEVQCAMAASDMQTLGKCESSLL